MAWPASVWDRYRDEGAQMNGADWGQLSYLVLLLVFIGATYMGRDRLSLGPALRMILIWVLIFGVVTLGYVVIWG